jgi:glycerophosphoryl diester phosphodiesterase
MRGWGGLRLLVLFSLLAVLAPDAHAGEPRGRKLEGTVDQLLDSNVGPFAIGHRGSGANQGEDPSRPIENTIPAVRRAFRAGVSVVEVDVQLTGDGEVAAYHDDILLPDFTCLNTLTLSELQARLPYVPSLQAVLNQARRFNEAPDPGSGQPWPRGLLIVELKAPAPLCDPGDLQEEALVSAVIKVIKKMGMRDQVMLASLSPALLAIARKKDSHIARILTISGLQFLTPEEAEAALCAQEPPLCLSITLIDKDDLGLQWVEVGPVFRLPGYHSLGEALKTAAVIEARLIEADLAFFFGLGEAAPFVVGQIQAYGLKVFGFSADSESEWSFLASLGVDGIYMDDVPLGVELQASGP